MTPLEPIGLVPAAGWGTRLGRLPCSKELLPIEALDGARGGERRVRVACEHLLDAMYHGGARRAHVVLRDGKWDIPAYLGSGASVGLELAYHVVSGSEGPADSIDAAYSFVRDREIVLGFPDLIFEPTEAFRPLLEKRAETRSDVVLGLFPTDRPEAMDVVETEPDGKVRRLAIKPERTTLLHAWIIAAWGPGFTEFLHDFVRGDRGDREAHVGQAFRGALEAGLVVDSITFDGGSCVDIGTPGTLATAWRGMPTGEARS